MRRLAQAAPLTLALAAGLAAAAIVLPAIAGSETTPTVDAVKIPGAKYPEPEFAWSPSQVSVVGGASVTFATATPEVPHGIKWTSTNKPTCTKGVPVEEERSDWSGSCTFTQPGTYTFYCTVHGPSMAGKVVVSPDGTTTTSTSTTTQSTTSTTTSTSGGPEERGEPSSPLSGSPSRAVRVPARQHGGRVRGTIAISQPGWSLRIALVAKRSHGLPKGGSHVTVGTLRRHALGRGKLTFAVHLNAAGHAALVHLHKLALTAKITLSDGNGRVLVVNRKVVVLR
jgi:plastocyanin